MPKKKGVPNIDGSGNQNMEENDSQKKNHNHSLFEELSISYPTI
jgi:hypothetical protein